MTSCPACGKPAEEPYPPQCLSCGARLEGATESFSPISDQDEEAPESGGTDLDQGPVLVVRKGPEVGERFFIDRPRLTVGRDPESGIFLNDITVSRNHAVLEFRAVEVTVEDRGSLNGTYVNGVRVDKALLADGDVVQVGRFQMVFMHGGGS